MTIPSDPSGNIPPPTPLNPQPEKTTSYVDPTGAWQKFLSAGGQQATADQVKMFLQGLLKMFNVLIQQQEAAAKRSAQRLKDAISGEQDE